MTNAVNIDFSGNIGTLSNAWNVDTSPNGQVTLSGSSAMMEPASGASAGHGYGTYTIVAKVDGSQPGPAIVFWPGNDQWPGQEIDLMEITPDGSGRQYGTVHWNAGGGDAYDAKIFDGVSSGVFHEYQMVWEPGKITMKVDGSTAATFTDHVPVDFDHGGLNDTIGFLNISNNTSITVDHVSYTPLGADATATASVNTAAAVSVPNIDVAASAVASVSTADAAHVDWDALAAQVTANYEATGLWFF
jgi:beta-glucanase (GH16 family)